MHKATLALKDYKARYKKEIPGGVPRYVVQLEKSSTRENLNRSRLLLGDFDTI